MSRLDLVRLLINSNYRVYDGSSYKLLMYYYRKVFLDKQRSGNNNLIFHTNGIRVSMEVNIYDTRHTVISINKIVRYISSNEDLVDMVNLAKIIAADEQIKNRKITNSK